MKILHSPSNLHWAFIHFWFTIEISEKKSMVILEWGNQTQAILDLSGIPVPPIYLHECWEHSRDFWGGFITTLERNFFGVRYCCRPPETPIRAEISASEAQNNPKSSREI